MAAADLTALLSRLKSDDDRRRRTWARASEIFEQSSGVRAWKAQAYLSAMQIFVRETGITIAENDDGR